MCERCEEEEKQEQILKSQKSLGCSKCSGCAIKPKIINLNEETENAKEILEELGKDVEKRHKELIAGYDKQLVDCLIEISKFQTKMLPMYDEYMKKGDIEECAKILQQIARYLILTMSSAATAQTTIEMILQKTRGSN
jgi:hypothetical protein